MRTPQVSEAGVVNSYTLPPGKLESGMQMLYTIKAMISSVQETDKEERTLTFSLYKCPHEATPNQGITKDEHGVPQGQQINGRAADIQKLGYALFPVLRNAGAIPDPYKYGFIEGGEK